MKNTLLSVAMLPLVVLTAIAAMALPIVFMMGLATVCNYLGHLFH